MECWCLCSWLSLEIGVKKYPQNSFWHVSSLQIRPGTGIQKPAWRTQGCHPFTVHDNSLLRLAWGKCSVKAVSVLLNLRQPNTYSSHLWFLLKYNSVPLQLLRMWTTFLVDAGVIGKKRNTVYFLPLYEICLGVMESYLPGCRYFPLDSQRFIGEVLLYVFKTAFWIILGVFSTSKGMKILNETVCKLQVFLNHSSSVSKYWVSLEK